jgi:hypothetical protein
LVCKVEIQARTSAQINEFERKFDEQAALNRSNMSGLADGLSELQVNMRSFVEAFMSLQPDGTGELRNPATLNEINDSITVNKVNQHAHLSLLISFIGDRSRPSYPAMWNLPQINRFFNHVFPLLSKRCKRHVSHPFLPSRTVPLILFRAMTTPQ